MFGQAHHLVGQQFQGPALAAGGRRGTGRGNQECLLLAGQLALSTAAWLFAQRRRHAGLHKTTLGPINRRTARPDAALDLAIARSAIGGQKDLSPLQFARAMLATAQQ